MLEDVNTSTWKCDVNTKLCIGVGDIAVDGVFDGLVVGLNGNLVLSGAALVVVVLELAAGDLLGAHDCGCYGGLIRANADVEVLWR